MNGSWYRLAWACTLVIVGCAQTPRIDLEAEEVHISPDGQMAYMTGTNEFTLPDATGQLVTTPGRAVTVWRKNAAGEWKCVYDIWNAAPVEGQGS